MLLCVTGKNKTDTVTVESIDHSVRFLCSCLRILQAEAVDQGDDGDQKVDGSGGVDRHAEIVDEPQDQENDHGHAQGLGALTDEGAKCVLGAGDDGYEVKDAHIAADDIDRDADTHDADQHQDLNKAAVLAFGGQYVTDDADGVDHTAGKAADDEVAQSKESVIADLHVENLILGLQK